MFSPDGMKAVEVSSSFVKLAFWCWTWGGLGTFVFFYSSYWEKGHLVWEGGCCHVLLPVSRLYCVEGQAAYALRVVWLRFASNLVSEERLTGKGPTMTESYSE